ncbi:hypothetical protein ACVGXB_01325, partial [Enterobacter intestinihominis]
AQRHRAFCRVAGTPYPTYMVFLNRRNTTRTANKITPTTGNTNPLLLGDATGVIIAPVSYKNIRAHQT